VIIGAGAIGVTLAAELHGAGESAVLIARGRQLEIGRAEGIRYVRPDSNETLAVPVFGDPAEVALTDDDVLVLATKTQDAGSAVALWAGQPVIAADESVTTAGRSLPLVTTQNGLETERIALRYFATVIGGVLGLPAHFVEPGVVVAPGSPAVGFAWLGAYPDRPLPLVDRIAEQWQRTNIDTAAVPDISRRKHAKLVVSTTFVLDALYPPSALRERAAELLRSETRAVLEAAGADVGDLRPPGRERRSFEVRPTPGYEYGGSSTWQSLARAGSLETDFINGEVVLQARLAGVQAPVNEALSARIHAVAAQVSEPRSLDDDDLRRTVPQLDGEAPAERSPAEQPAAGRSEVVIEPAELHRLLRGAHPPLVLDVRWKLGDPDGRLHYEEAHIATAVYVDLETELAGPPSPGAGRHPLPSVEELQLTARGWGLAQDQPVVVYDDVGGLSAARAWWLLRWAGVTDVRILDGALAAWAAAGLPVETGPSPVGDGDVTLSEGHLPLLDATGADELARTGVLLDARAKERYRGEVEPVDPRAGHIPGALSAPTAENLAADGTFSTTEVLRSRFRELGIDDSTEVGVYCGSGVTAAHEIAALRIAGVDAALFAGSWSAWSSDPDRPVAVGEASDPVLTGATEHAS
jgi:thiosulfate/3-mercaptopyruvate sulfurtransferase